MDFLGNVNVFQGRVEHGRALLGNLEVDCVGNGHHHTDSASFYVRPHELDIDRPGGAGLSARVTHINPAGPVVRVQLILAELGMPILVELTQAKAADLKLGVGENVFVAPRRVRFFMPEYSI